MSVIVVWLMGRVDVIVFGEGLIFIVGVIVETKSGSTRTVKNKIDIALALSCCKGLHRGKITRKPVVSISGELELVGMLGSCSESRYEGHALPKSKWRAKSK
jgi:hypothetical protein